MNRARNRRRNLALFRYERATAHADQAQPSPPWITWRPVCSSITCPPFQAVQLGGFEVGRFISDTLDKFATALRRAGALPAGFTLAYDDTPLSAVGAYETYWPMEDGSPAHAITTEDGTVVYAATTAAPIRFGVDYGTQVDYEMIQLDEHPGRHCDGEPA